MDRWGQPMVPELLSREKIDVERIRRILIRSTNWIGDAVMTTPAIRSIRRNFPDARITILVLPWVRDVFSACPHIDDFFIYEKQLMLYCVALQFFFSTYRFYNKTTIKTFLQMPRPVFPTKYLLPLFPMIENKKPEYVLSTTIKL